MLYWKEIIIYSTFIILRNIFVVDVVFIMLYLFSFAFSCLIYPLFVVFSL